MYTKDSITEWTWNIMKPFSPMPDQWRRHERHISIVGMAKMTAVPVSFIYVAVVITISEDVLGPVLPLK